MGFSVGFKSHKKMDLLLLIESWIKHSSVWRFSKSGGRVLCKFEETTEDVEPTKIFNYEETNLSGNPETK